MPEAVRHLKFVVDHIIARQHDGPTELENLAFCCGHCNLHKGPNIAGIDPESRQFCQLFHPRHDNWAEHFRWQGPLLVGASAVGRATIAVLAINDPVQIMTRRALMNEGAFPL
jgi:cation diffusion facilitator CzcD-associated flavoprotein CzcO